MFEGIAVWRAPSLQRTRRSRKLAACTPVLVYFFSQKLIKVITKFASMHLPGGTVDRDFYRLLYCTRHVMMQTSFAIRHSGNFLEARLTSLPHRIM